MFWNKKRDDQLIDIVNTVCSELTKRINKQDAKLDLILDHLKLKYVPETETKQPARLRDTSRDTSSLADFGPGDIIKVNLPKDFGVVEQDLVGRMANRIIFKTSGTSDMKTPPKKKGRPKKK